MIFNEKAYIIYEKINCTSNLNYSINISPHLDLICPGGKHRTF